MSSGSGVHEGISDHTYIVRYLWGRERELCAIIRDQEVSRLVMLKVSFFFILCYQRHVHCCLLPYTEDDLHSFSSYVVSVLELFDEECEYPG